jgi:tetratricopeptide (TPR) repeat protein
MTARVLVVLALVAGAAAAEPKKEDRAQAAAHFKQGQAFYKNGDYDHAIQEYQAAYALSQEPLLLFNIALCNDKAQRPEKALEGFQHYLDLAPDGEVAEEAREDIARLTPIVDQIRAKRAAEDAQRADANARAKQEADAARRAEEAKRADAAKRAQAARDAAAAPIAQRARHERWAGYAGLGLAAISAGWAVREGVVAKQDSDAVASNTKGWTDALLAKEREGRSANDQMYFWAGAAGALAVAGGVMFWLAHRNEQHAEEVRVGALPLPGGAAVSVTVRF